MRSDAEPETFPSGIPKVRVNLPASPPDVLIVTGMSGAGKSRAADVIADEGWYVVDNLPPQMLAEMVTMVSREGYVRLAAVVDVRGGKFFADLEAVLGDLEAGAVPARVMFLEASDDVLVRRFEQVRRPHPLQGQGTLAEAIRTERLALGPMRERADIVIDTSSINVHELAERIVAEVGDFEASPLQVNVQSFGFKNGAPEDADFLADVRFLDNPHWIPELRPLTGLDAPVRDHVLAAAGASEFLDAYSAALDIALSRYRAHDKHFVTVAIGCTGGHHRSVAMTEALAERLRELGYAVRASHRDRERE
jgi:UPF0042 nucleotide-binding protein